MKREDEKVYLLVYTTLIKHGDQRSRLFVKSTDIKEERERERERERVASRLQSLCNNMSTNILLWVIWSDGSSPWHLLKPFRKWFMCQLLYLPHGWAWFQQLFTWTRNKVTRTLLTCTTVLRIFFFSSFILFFPAVNAISSWTHI